MYAMIILSRVSVLAMMFVLAMAYLLEITTEKVFAGLKELAMWFKFLQSYKYL